jgi:hypothetical protein
LPASCNEQLGEPGAERVEGALQRGCDGAQYWEGGGEARAQQTIVGSREEQGDAQAKVSDAIAEAFGRTLDQAMQVQTAQLVGDGALGD